MGIRKATQTGRPVQLALPFLLAPPELQVGYELLVLSYGIGQDSWAILLKLVYDEMFRARYAARRFLVLTAETGNEHPETYAHLAYTQAFCSRHGIEFIHVVPAMGYHPDGWQYLEHLWERKSVIGSKAYVKSCTDRLKITPLYRCLEVWLGREYGVPVGRKQGFIEFARRYGKIGMLIGLTAGEEKRQAGEAAEPWRRASIQTRYPLIEAGMTRADCQAYAASVGEPVPQPSNCMMCCWANEAEILWLYRRYPEVFQRWVEHEARKLAANAHMGDKNLGVFGRRALPEVLESARAKYGHWSETRLDEYKFSHGHSACSRY